MLAWRFLSDGVVRQKEPVVRSRQQERTRPSDELSACSRSRCTMNPMIGSNFL
jgi:hypothetical protein